jgi:predicted HicB family RNase H-like nuclease
VITPKIMEAYNEIKDGIKVFVALDDNHRVILDHFSNKFNNHKLILTTDLQSGYSLEMDFKSDEIRLEISFVTNKSEEEFRKACRKIVAEPKRCWSYKTRHGHFRHRASFFYKISKRNIQRSYDLFVLKEKLESEVR